MLRGSDMSEIDFSTEVFLKDGNRESLHGYFYIYLEGPVCEQISYSIHSPRCRILYNLTYQEEIMYTIEETIRHE